MSLNSELWNEIRQYSKEIGIDLIGVASAAPFMHYETRFKKRKEFGYLCGFEYKKGQDSLIEYKINPALIMPDVKCILSVGISYNYDYGKCEANEEKKNDEGFRGKLSKCYWGMDYHVVVRDKLVELMDYMKDRYEGLKYDIFVDTGDLPDREIAYRAGLGFFGKNNMLINEEYGSFIFLGHCLLNIELPVNENCIESKCGECEKCLMACPPKALGKDYMFNAMKCISFNTQRKDDIPDEVLNVMGKTIFGCDVCQDICPYNITAKKVNHKEFYYSYDCRYPELEIIINKSNKEMKEFFKGSGCLWRGKKPLQRNAKFILDKQKRDH